MRKLLLCVMLVICGCQRRVVIHPIEKSDIFFVPAGSVITDANDAWTVEKDGWFLSETYVQEVMDAKIQ